MTAGTKLGILVIGSILLLVWGAAGVSADDFKDRIADVTDDAVMPEDNLPDKTVNLHYVIADAVGQAKKVKKEIGKVKSNISTATGDSAQNSIIVEAGSQVDTVININSHP